MASLELNDAQGDPPMNGHPNGERLSNGHGPNGVDAPSVKDESLDQDSVYYPCPTDFKLTEKPVDEARQLDVAIIGAGLSGITSGILLPAKVPGINLTILEKNADVGGTWLENRYPGVSPNTQWSEEYAQGAEIRRYWQSVAKKHDVYFKVKFNTRVLQCQWNSDRAKWQIDTEFTLTKERSMLEVNFLITAIGHFNAWKLPNYPGMDKFKGPIIHSSGWDPNLQYEGKGIATIGNGASGIQVTTEVRKLAAHVDHYARSRTFIAGSFNPASTERQDTPLYIKDELKESFKDPEVYLKWRKELEDTFWRAFDDQIADSESSKKMRGNFIKLMEKRLGDDASLLDKLVPNFPPHCRRLTPGPGYLEALTKPNLAFIQTPIKEFTEDGITTIDGVHRPVDAVICSTGANTDFAPPFPIIAGEYDLCRDWRPDGKFGWPYTYLGAAVPHFPNLSFLLGPHPAGPSGTVPVAVETQAAYIAKMLRKISS